LQEHGLTSQVSQKLEKKYFDPTPESDLIALDKVRTLLEFDQVVAKHDWLIVEVGAENCAGCKLLYPVVQSVGTKLKDKAKFVSINLDDEPQELIERFKLKTVPALLIFKKGKLVARYDQQLFSKRELLSTLNTLMAH
jgi:thiol-disulfide isomerase/thioredoxin